MKIDLTPLVSDAIVLLASICSVFVVVKLVPEIKKLWKPFAQQWPMEATFLEAQTELAVKAAEQTMGAGAGGAKLLYALEYVQRQAERYGFAFNKFDVQVLVEAKVREMKERAAVSITEK